MAQKGSTPDISLSMASFVQRTSFVGAKVGEVEGEREGTAEGSAVVGEPVGLDVDSVGEPDGVGVGSFVGGMQIPQARGQSF